MKDGTLNIIKSILDNDDSVTQEDKIAILAFCKSPTVSPATTSQPLTYLPPKEVAKKMGVSLRTVQQWIASGKLRSHKIGKLRRVPSIAIESFISQHSSLKVIDVNGRQCTMTVNLDQVQDLSAKEMAS